MSRRLSCVHFTCPKRCEPRWFLQLLFSTALELLLKDEARGSAKGAGVVPSTRTSSSSGSSPSANGSGNVNAGNDTPAGPTLLAHEVGPGSLPFQIGALYTLYALHGTQLGQNRQPIRVNAQGLLGLLFLRKRLKAAGALGIDALAVLARLVRDGLGSLQPAAYSGPSTLAYLDSLLLPTKKKTRLSSIWEDLKKKNAVAGAQAAAARAAAAAAAATAGVIHEYVGEGGAGESSASPPTALRADASASEVQSRETWVAAPFGDTAVTKWGPQDRAATAIKSAFIRIQGLSSLYESYSAALGLARSVGDEANGIQSRSDGGSNIRPASNGMDSNFRHEQSAALDVGQIPLTNRNERFQQDLAVMIEGARARVGARMAPPDAHGLEHLARKPLITSPPSSPPRSSMSPRLPPLPPLPQLASIGSRVTRRQANMASAAMATSINQEKGPMRSEREHIAVPGAARDAQNEAEEKRGTTDARASPAGAGSEQRETTTSRGKNKTATGNLRLPGGLGITPTLEEKFREESSDEGDGDGLAIGEIADDAASCGNDSPVQTNFTSRVGQRKETPGTIDGRGRGRGSSSVGSRCDGRGRGQVSSGIARSIGPRRANEIEQGEEEEEEDEDSSETDEIDDFARIMNSIGNLVAAGTGRQTARGAGSKSSEGNIPSRVSSVNPSSSSAVAQSRGSEDQSDEGIGANRSSPVVAPVPRKRGRPKKQPARSPAGEGQEAEAPAATKPRGRPPKNSAKAPSQPQVGRGGRGAGKGSPGGGRVVEGRGQGRGVGGRQVTSIAAAEAAAAARKRKASMAKERAASALERVDGEQAKRVTRGKRVDKDDEHEDSSEDNEAELAFFVRDVSRLSAIANGQGTPSDETAMLAPPVAKQVPASGRKTKGKQRAAAPTSSVRVATDGKRRGQGQRPSITDRSDVDDASPTRAKRKKKDSFFVTRADKTPQARGRSGTARAATVDRNASTSASRDSASRRSNKHDNGILPSYAAAVEESQGSSPSALTTRGISALSRRPDRADGAGDGTSSDSEFYISGKRVGSGRRDGVLDKSPEGVSTRSARENEALAGAGRSAGSKGGWLEAKGRSPGGDATKSGARGGAKDGQGERREKVRGNNVLLD